MALDKNEILDSITATLGQKDNPDWEEVRDRLSSMPNRPLLALETAILCAVGNVIMEREHSTLNLNPGCEGCPTCGGTGFENVIRTCSQCQAEGRL